MTYIPVGTRLTYTASFQGKYLNLEFTWEELAAKLKADLPNLPGLEDLEVESSDGTNSIFGNNTLLLNILNNGVDHGDEHDVQGIIDGTITGYGITLVSSDITSITLPDNPKEEIQTGAKTNVPAPSSFSLSNLVPSISTGTKLLTTGTIIIIALVALVLLLPGGFAKALKAVK